MKTAEGKYFVGVIIWSEPDCIITHLDGPVEIIYLIEYLETMGERDAKIS